MYIYIYIDTCLWYSEYSDIVYIVSYGSKPGTSPPRSSSLKHFRRSYLAGSIGVNGYQNCHQEKIQEYMNTVLEGVYISIFFQWNVKPVGNTF